MALPITKHPLFPVKVPSSGETVKVRPMLVKEEKILLMAKETQDYRQFLLAAKQIVQNCIGEGVDVDKLKIFDIEYLFLQIRANSVDNIVKVAYEDTEDEKEYSFEIELDKVEVQMPTEPNFFIQLTETTGITMKWPDAAVYSDERYEKFELEDDALLSFLVDCMDTYVDGDTVTVIRNEKFDDVKAFVENLDIKTYGKLTEFIANIPKLYHEIKYTNSKGSERVIKLQTLLDFFIY